MEVIKKNPATWAVIIINGLVFLLVELTGGSENIENMLRWGAEFAPLIQQDGEYYRLFTCMFLHFGLAHLGNNMLVLYFVGETLEREAGKLRFLVIYLGGGLGASFLSYYADIRENSAAVSAGASGAVFAVMGAVLWILIINRGRVENLTIRQMAFMAGLSLYFGFTSTGVDNTAHVGGLVVGFLLAVLIYRPRKKPEIPVADWKDL